MRGRSRVLPARPRSCRRHLHPRHPPLSAPGAALVTPHLAVNSSGTPTSTSGCSQLGARSSPLCFTQALQLPPANPSRPRRSRAGTRSGVKCCSNCCSPGAKCGGRGFWQKTLSPRGPVLLGNACFPSSRDQSSKCTAWGPRPSPELGDILHPCIASAPQSQRNAGQHWGFGERLGWLFTSSSSAHPCTHVDTHMLMPSHTLQTEPMISLICHIVAIQPAPLRLLLVYGQICARRFPYPPPPGCH